LVQELSLVMTPTPVQPAETTGQAGFDFGIDYVIHDISEDQAYWADAVEGRLENRDLLPILQTIGVRGRKGFPLPIPLTSEVELGANWIVDSQMLNLGGNVRLALNEGFRWIPDLAVSAGVNRLVGTEDLDMFTVTAGGSISKGFGIGGTINVAPFLGYQSIFVNASSRVIDPTPGFIEDVGDNVVFNEVQISDPTTRIDRLEAGVRVQAAIVELSTGFNFNLLPDINGGNDRRLFMQYAIRAGLYF
jgi:hypothetical protein